MTKERMTRRDFVKNAGVGLASAGAFGFLGAHGSSNAREASEAGSQSGSGEHLTMWVMDPTRLAPVGAMASAFTKKTGITVTLDVVPWSAAQAKFAATFQAGTAPDVTETAWGTAAYFWGKGDLMDMGHVVSKLGADNFNSITQSHYKGHYTCIPWFLETRILFYRKDWFDDAGLNAPTDWSTLESAVKKLVAKGHPGFALPYFKNSFTGQCFWTWYINENPEKPIDIVDSKGNPLVNSEYKKYAVDALTDYTNYWEHHLAPAGSLASTTNYDLYTLFAIGGASTIVANGGLVTTINTQDPSLITDGKVAAVPMISKTGAPGWSLPGGSVLWISKHTKYADAATKWVEFLSAPAQQITMFKSLSTAMPAYKPSLQNDYVKSSPLLTKLTQQLSRTRGAGTKLKPQGTNDPRLTLYGADNDDSLPVIEVIAEKQSPSQAVSGWQSAISTVFSTSS